MSAAKNHIKVLDGLRALAILLVVGRHSLKGYWTDLTVPFLPLGPIDLAVFLQNGWVGVDLFFVLSGFLITSQLLTPGLKSPATRKKEVLYFYRKRYFRIAPVYYLILTLVAAGLFPPFPTTDPDTVWGWRYIYHLLFLNDYFPSDICFVFWSLAVEFKFYLIAPLLVLGLIKMKALRWKVFLIAVAISSVILARLGTALYISPATDFVTYFEDIRTSFHLSLDGLLAGTLCAILWQDGAFRAWLGRPYVANGFFFAGLALFLGLTAPALLVDLEVSLWDKVLLPTAIAAGFALMMLGLMGGSYGQRLFQSGILRFIAIISYSLYLTHILFYYPAASAAEGLFYDPATPARSWAVFLIPYLIIPICFSTLLYYFVERPFIRWSKHKKELF